MKNNFNSSESNWNKVNLDQFNCGAIDENNIPLSEHSHINDQNSNIIDNPSNNPNITSIIDEPFINTTESNEN